MNAASRRKKIIEILSKAEEAISATTLAEKLDVSRQIIVGDVALLRASGEEIMSTPRGYVAKNALSQTEKIIRQIPCIHSSKETKEELQICVDQGCAVLDVVVDHPIYGQLTGQLQLKSRYDVDQFCEKCAQESAHVLSELTDGIHLHTLECPTVAAYERVCEKLKERGFLYTEKNSKKKK